MGRGKILGSPSACWLRVGCPVWRVAGIADTRVSAELGWLGNRLDFLLACEVEGTLSRRAWLAVML